MIKHTPRAVFIIFNADADAGGSFGTDGLSKHIISLKHLSHVFF
jgi:hypothetical protein